MKRSEKTDSDANAKSSKRPREEEEQTAPQYGSKEYWEARYTNAEKDNVATTGHDKIDDTDNYVLDGIELSKDATSPGHAWYFTYAELRPLILPLIVGGAANRGECDDGDSWVEEEVDEEEAVDGTVEDDEGEDGGDDNEEAEEYTVPDKPKKVLEVGCGDVPLGVKLAADLVKMQQDTGVSAELFVNEISCIDYSEIVVNTLIDKQKKENEGSATLQASFNSLDARDLPYSRNRYDLVLEKGTLDAMLSDQEEGKQNCIKIVKEMARVTNIGGSMLIVSHLNANETKGLNWLEGVVFAGLEAEFSERHKATPKKQQEEYVWSVEVHGGEGEINKDEVSFGPAVYIIRKSAPSPIAQEVSGKKKDLENKKTMSPVKVHFLTYD